MKGGQKIIVDATNVESVEVSIRKNKNGENKVVDKRRDEVAEKIGFITYLGVYLHRAFFSKSQNPCVQRFVLIQLLNGMKMAMTANAFYNKLNVSAGFKKLNSLAEELIVELLQKFNVKFLREATIIGFELNEKYIKAEEEGSLTYEDKHLLKRLSKAIVDFVISTENSTILLSAEGTMHHKEYDEDWNKFVSSGLAEKLGYQYIAFNTITDKKLEGNYELQMDLLNCLSNKLNLSKINLDDLGVFNTRINWKKAHYNYSKNNDEF